MGSDSGFEWCLMTAALLTVASVGEFSVLLFLFGKKGWFELGVLEGNGATL